MWVLDLYQTLLVVFVPPPSSISFFPSQIKATLSSFKALKWSKYTNLEEISCSLICALDKYILYTQLIFNEMALVFTFRWNLENESSILQGGFKTILQDLFAETVSASIVSPTKYMKGSCKSWKSEKFSW